MNTVGVVEPAVTIWRLGVKLAGSSMLAAPKAVRSSELKEVIESASLKSAWDSEPLPTTTISAIEGGGGGTAWSASDPVSSSWAWAQTAARSARQKPELRR